MFRKQNLPMTAFFVVMIISASLLVLPMWNYSRFYMALWNFDYTVSKVTIDTSQIKATNTALISVAFTIINPTDYSGLQVSQVGCDLQYFGTPHEVPVPSSGGTEWVPTNLWELKVGYTTQSYLISPNTNGTISLKFSINPNGASQSEQQNAWAFIDYLETKPSQIQWSLSCSLWLSTFLSTFERSKGFTPVTPLN